MRGVALLFTAAATAAASAVVLAPARASAHAAARPLPLPPGGAALVTRPLPPAGRALAPDARASVTGVRVEAAASAGATVVVQLDRAVSVQDFVLDAPRRVVLDLQGAALGATSVTRYDGTPRGGVVNVRVAQYRAAVVRVVVELDGRQRYRVERSADQVRLVVEGPPGGFAAWEGGSGAAPGVSRGALTPPVDTAPPISPATGRAVERSSDARPEPRPEPARRAPVPVPVASRITVTYQDADIRDVVASFAAFSGRTIIVGREVTGTVTAEIKDQPWDVALHAVLRTQGLAAAEDRNGIITVDSYRNLATNRAVEPLVTQIVEVNYAKAGTLVPLIQTLLSRDCGGSTVLPDGAPAAAAAQAPGGGRTCAVRGAVSADTATNKLLITDVPSNLPDIAARLRELDVRTPQVAIKAKIIFVNRTGLEDIGVSYDLGTGAKQFFSQLVQRLDPTTAKPIDTDGDGVPDARGGATAFTGDRVSIGGNALSALANAGNAIKPSALNLIYSAAVGRFDITTFINALQQTQLADVQSEPSIVTLNNRTAEIFVGQQIPIRVIDASAGGQGGGGGGGGSFPRATVRLEEAGIRLSVTPQVTNNRRVVLDVRAENSNAQVGPSDVGVVFNRQRAENRLLVGDGETAVIGGLTVTEKSRVRTGIPFLMNLPLLGRLFGQTTTSEIKRDLLILVTPHILDEGEAAPIPGPRR